MVAIVGYDLGPLRFGQEVAWHRARLNAISANGMESGVTGEISQLKLLSRNRLAFRLTPGVASHGLPQPGPWCLEGDNRI